MTKEELEIDNKRLDFNEKVQLVVKREELKEQDIRLNKLCFDYQEKEKQIEIDAEHIRALQKQNGELTDKVRELEARIEEMKCCYNCSKWYDGECEESPKSKTFFCADFKCDKWEIKEND